MLSNDQIYVFTWVSPPKTGGSKLQNLIFTGCSHKAIAEHAGLSTAQLQQEFQQQVVKAKLLWSLIKQHTMGNIRYWPIRGKRRIIFVSSVENRSCSDRHSNYWGKPLWFKLLFYGWILVQHQRTEIFHYASEKSKPATKMAKTDEKGKEKPSVAQRKPGLGVGARLQRLKQTNKK